MIKLFGRLLKQPTTPTRAKGRTLHTTQEPLLQIKSSRLDHYLLNPKNCSTQQLQDAIREYWELSKTNSVSNLKSHIPNNNRFFNGGENLQIDDSIYNTCPMYRCFLRWELIRSNSSLQRKFMEIGIPQKTVLSTTVKRISDIFPHLIQNCIAYQDIPNAVDLFIWHYSKNPDRLLDENMIHEITNSIAYSNPLKPEHLFSKFVQFMNFVTERIKTYEITEQHALQICANALSLENDALLLKKVLGYVLNMPCKNSNTVRSTQVKALYSLISLDCRRNNPAGVLLHWTKVRELYATISNHDTRILYKIIKLFTKQKAYRSKCADLVSAIEPEHFVNNSLLLPSIINFASATHNFPLATKIMTDITMYSNIDTQNKILKSRLFLSTLLRLHLTFQDSIGVERVLKEIRKEHGILTSADYQVIITHLLKSKKTDDLMRALTLSQKIEGFKALPSIITIINYLTLLRQDEMKNKKLNVRAVIYNMILKAHKIDPAHKDKMWDILASIFIRSLTTYKNTTSIMWVNNNKGKFSSIDFLRHCYENSKTKRPKDITINPFASPSPRDIILKISASNVVVILRTIAKEASCQRRKDVFLWCMNEMTENGMSREEIELDWNSMQKHQIRRSKDKSSNGITENLKEHGLKDFKRLLLKI
ncbi:LAQU0S27e00144g1_1 [Lachancea quebecensis]|uniref:LAQU0S27e00144g1_1 n=1 Tax=Lachancea quebecensis TaxID=1654605 RepID=A0A0N7MMH2_9SACH|nr:LAQU0S27e00144g1_1 [Lachancea quebecensis]